MSRRIIETSIDIAAPADRVWQSLTDFAAFPQWSRFILAIDGDVRPGARLSVDLDDGGGKMKMAPEVVAAESPVELRWRGVVGARFLFSGEHSFRLDSLPGGGTRLTHSEIFRGLLVPFFWKTLDSRTRQAFHAFNAALKGRAETAAGLAS
jgi:hypothetical protein